MSSGAVIVIAPDAKRLKMEDEAEGGSPMVHDDDESSLGKVQFLVTQLPDDLKSRIAQFLAAKDALRFSSTCKNLFQSLALSCLQPSIIFENLVAWSGDSRTGDTPRKYRRIPILFQSRVHSVIVQLHWRDQGWGNSKGQIYVVASREKEIPADSTADNTNGETNPQPGDRFQGGRLVYESPIAQHTDEPLRISFSPKPDETYYFWFKAGGGGGHMLSLRNVRIQMLVQADFGRHLNRNYAALQKHALLEFTAPRPPGPDLVGTRPPLGVSTFYMNLLLQVARSLLTQLEEKEHAVDKGLSTYLTSHGIEVTTDSLAALIEIVTTILEEHTRRTEEQVAFMERLRQHREQQQQQQQQQNQRNGQPQAVHIRIDMPELMERAQQALIGHLPDFLQGAEEALGVAEEAFGQVGEAFARAEIDLQNLDQDAEQRPQAENNNHNINIQGGILGPIVHHEAFVIGGGVIPIGFGDGVFMQQPPRPFFFRAEAAQNPDNNARQQPANDDNDADDDDTD